MKKTILASIVAAVGLSTSMAFADPASLVVDVMCPGTTGIVNVLSNYGDHIKGAGTVTIVGLPGPTQAYFNVSITPGAFPAKLLSYSNSGTDYDSTTATISCSYTSSVSGQDPFTVTYVAENFRGGVIDVANQTISTIRIVSAFGLKK